MCVYTESQMRVSPLHKIKNVYHETCFHIHICVCVNRESDKIRPPHKSKFPCIMKHDFISICIYMNMTTKNESANQ